MVTYPDKPIAREMLVKLTDQAIFRADDVAIRANAAPITQAVKTRAVVMATIEFLLGNGLISVNEENFEAWLRIDPPYDARFLK